MKATALAVLAIGVWGNVARAVDVSACGQVVPAGEVGILVTSLDCSGVPGTDGVVLLNRASLELRGNTIISPSAGASVSCQGARCAVSGPGFLLSVPFRGTGIAAAKSVTVSGNVEIAGHEVGIAAGEGQVTASDTFLSDNGDGIVARKVRGTNVFVRDSDRIGINAFKGIRGDHIEVRDNGTAGIYTARFTFTELIATTNGMTSTFLGGGIVATRRGRLTDSLVSGNTLLGAPADVVTGRSPILINTVCDASVMLTDSGGSRTWGVCGLD